MININLPKDTLRYIGAVAIIFGAWLGAYVWGIHLGAQQSKTTHRDQLTECVSKINKVHTQFIEAHLQLVECQAVDNGECTLNCEATIQRRVNSVLQEVTCEN